MEGHEIPTEVVEKLSPATRNLFKDEKVNIKNNIPVNELIESMGNSNDNGKKDVSNEKYNNLYFR